MPDDARANQHELADRLHSVAIHMLRALRVEDEASGLSPSRLSALSVVVFAGPLRLSDLATKEGVSAPTMSRLARALEADGLIQRQPDPDDGRSALFEATSVGRRLLDEARQRRLERLAGGLEGLDQHSITQLRAAVALLEERFDRTRTRGT